MYGIEAVMSSRLRVAQMAMSQPATEKLGTKLNPYLPELLCGVFVLDVDKLTTLLCE